jgi:hypothetical protein
LFPRIIGVQTNEELSDVYAHFQLYYGSEMRRIVEWERLSTLQDSQNDVEISSKFKLGSRTDKYMVNFILSFLFLELSYVYSFILLALYSLRPYTHG